MKDTAPDSAKLPFRTVSFEISRMNPEDEFVDMESISQGLSDMHINQEHFYLTGFEGIHVGAQRKETTMAVISTAVPMCAEVLIICESQTYAYYNAMCKALNIKTTLVDAADFTIEDLKGELNANRRITHVLCADTLDVDTLYNIGQLLREMHRGFVVEKLHDNELDLGIIDGLAIDYLIDSAEDGGSLVVARRSKLVQAEGNARPATTDIYAVWQNGLGMRKPTLVPMH